jgi:AGZA family xanthine/uracil permease-like MFS transporter
MIGSVTQIDFSEASEGIPAFLIVAGMAFTYSISDGIVFGVVSYVVIKLCTNRVKDLNFMIVTIALLFLGKFLPGAWFVYYAMIVIACAFLIWGILKFKSNTTPTIDELKEVRS